MAPHDVAPRRVTPPPLVACCLIGVVAAVLGLVPWLVTGMRLPLRNLWAVQTAPGQMPVVLLPFNHYFLSTPAALLVIGGAVAGAAASTLGRRLPDRAWVAILLGPVLVAAVVAALGLWVVRLLPTLSADPGEPDAAESRRRVSGTNR